jgi:hypothetical protein
MAFNGNGHSRNPLTTLRDYWWAWATEPESGRLIVLGWYNSENEAYQDAIGKMQGIPFEVTALKTRDRTFAKAKLNYIRLEKGTAVQDMVKRAKYKV